MRKKRAEKIGPSVPRGGKARKGKRTLRQTPRRAMKRSRRPGVLRNFALPLDASTSANLSRPPPCQNPLPHALTLMQTRVLVLARAPLEVGDEGLEADEDGDDRAHVARVAQ
eukprot:388906-Rhodomonas_salina.1